jgi:hypothetical protein
MEDSFAFAIQDHLELQRRNRLLEGDMPLSGYREPRANGRGHAVALEDTQEWVMPDSPEWVVPDSPALLEHEPLFPPAEPEQLFPPAEQLWSGGPPAFDWGD